MTAQSRQTFILVHVVLAGFFLPLALIFAITGGLYTFGIKGDYNTKNDKATLTIPTEPNLTEATAIATEYLKSQGRDAVPTGSPGLRKVGTSWSFEWPGIRYDFSMEPTAEAGVYKTVIKDTSMHRFFVQLHKAKGGLPFKVLAGAFGAALLILFFSGIVISLAVPKLRVRMYQSTILGLAACAAAAWTS